jgi:hypothetical protein
MWYALEQLKAASLRIVHRLPSMDVLRVSIGLFARWHQLEWIRIDQL